MTCWTWLEAAMRSPKMIQCQGTHLAPLLRVPSCLCGWDGQIMDVISRLGDRMALHLPKGVSGARPVSNGTERQQTAIADKGVSLLMDFLIHQSAFMIEPCTSAVIRQ